MPIRISKNRVSLENLPLNECLSTVASATTPDIWTNTCNVINYTGTATATGFATAPQAGARRTLVCAGAAVFTAGANMLIDGVSSGNNFTAATGDKIHIIAVTTTQFRLTPAKYDGTAVIGAPTGTVAQYAGSSAPTGWLLCDGTAVSRATYAALFAIIGTTYGVGDGSTTFNLPDIRGRAPIGAGQGSGLTNRALAATGGAETHTLTIAEMPAHTHGGVFVNAAGYLPGSNAVVEFNFGSTGSAGGSGAHNNMQPFLVLNYIIKT